MRRIASVAVLVCFGVIASRAQSANSSSIGTLDIATLQPQASAGVAAAEAELGSRYMQGLGVPRDMAQASLWFNKAAAQNDVQGIWGVASLCWLRRIFGMLVHGERLCICSGATRSADPEK